MIARKLWVLPLSALAIAGCAQEEGPLGPWQGAGGEVNATLACQVDIRGGALSCALPEGETGAASGAIIGDQGLFVLLESAGVSYDPSDPDGPAFKADVTVRNFMGQTIGTTDGTTIDPNGIRVFFHSAPQVTEGTGTVAVRNADGSGDFTGTAQPYFQYDEMLAPGEGTFAKTWIWDVPETVDRFTFYVGVSASAVDESALAPGTHLLASTLTVGHQFACALDTDGKAWCWGANDYGQLGIGEPGDKGVPTPVNTGLTFKQIHAGQYHACAISTDDDAYCWGNGASGRLGQGSTNSAFSPTKVDSDIKFRMISAGGALTCAVSLSNDAYCWGGNGNAKTGQGTTSGSTTSPALIRGDYKYLSVSAGYYQGCGLTTDNVAVCWGNSNLGRLGVGDTTGNLYDPTPIAVDEKFRYVETGSAYTCGLTIDDDAWCWGVGGSGQTGFGVADTVWAPRKVLGDHKFSTMSVRFAHTCATKANGEAWCWGNAGAGRLGTGSTTNESIPVQVDSNLSFAYVGTGHSHTCGVTTEGRVYCWGLAGNGRLGTGQIYDRDRPTPVSVVNQ